MARGSATDGLHLGQTRITHICNPTVAHMTDPNRIEKQITLRAPRTRVWRAISDAREFGQWFGVNLDGNFEPGKTITGRMVNPAYQHVPFTLNVERIEPEHLFSYRWRPYAIDPAVDYSAEPLTLVEFHLEEVDGGTRLTVVESGFEGIPAHRRAEAFRMNDKGWTAQVENIRRYVEA